MIIKIIIVITLIILVWVVCDYTPIVKGPLGNILYGTSKCIEYNSEQSGKAYELQVNSDPDHDPNSLSVLTRWKCKLCYRIKIHPSSPAPKLCDVCANITNRCNKCGKLKK